MNVKPNVINFHFVDFCNFACRYCFVKKINRMSSFHNIKLIVDNLADYFDSIHAPGRINLVGGEIFMCSYLQPIIDYINSKCIEVSIVTNGLLLTDEFLLNNVNKIKCIGISVDSLEYDTNIKIGRCCGKKVLTKDELINKCKIIKKLGYKLKINHCISKYNVNEDITKLLEKVDVDRFKIFQMSIVEGINDCCKNKQVTINEFRDASRKYLKYNPIIEEESEMKSSYLMIDSSGDFYIDRSDAAIGNVLEESFISLMGRAKLDDASFVKRYIQLQG